jgi:hypothetical protein
MRRIPFIAVCAVALAALALAPAASGATTHKRCTASSGKVVGKKIVGKLAASNVDSSQARFATCGQAKRVMSKVAALGLEEPRGNVGGFYCVPTVFFTNPDFVRYKCTFKSADTAQFVKLLFALQYKS